MSPAEALWSAPDSQQVIPGSASLKWHQSTTSLTTYKTISYGAAQNAYFFISKSPSSFWLNPQVLSNYLLYILFILGVPAPPLETPLFQPLCDIAKHKKIPLPGIQ